MAISLQTSLKKLAVKGVDAVVHETPKAKATIILSHELHGSKDSPGCELLARDLTEQGYRVVRYGNSNSLKDAASQMQVTLKKVVNQTKSQYGGKIAVIGMSFGGSIALLEAAENTNIATIITLGSPLLPQILSLKKNQVQKNSFRMSGREIAYTQEFKNDVEAKDSLGAIKKITIPLMFIHGMEDDEVPFDHSKQAHKATVGKKELHPVSNTHYVEDLDTQREIKNLVENWLAKTL